jgi:hypothetical protein
MSLILPRGAVTSLYIAVRLAKSPCDMLFDRLGRNPQALGHLPVRTFVKDPQRKSRAALRGQLINRFLDEPVPLVFQQSRFQ